MMSILRYLCASEKRAGREVMCSGSRGRTRGFPRPRRAGRLLGCVRLWRRCARGVRATRARSSAAAAAALRAACLSPCVRSHGARCGKAYLERGVSTRRADDEADELEADEPPGERAVQVAYGSRHGSRRGGAPRRKELPHAANSSSREQGRCFHGVN